VEKERNLGGGKTARVNIWCNMRGERKIYGVGEREVGKNRGYLSAAKTEILGENRRVEGGKDTLF